MKHFSLKQFVLSGIIAALYVALTVPLGSYATSSFINIRPAEALTILPVFFVEAIPGVTVGCLLSNILAGGATVPDIILGTLITLVSAVLTRSLRRPLLAALPPVLLNGLLLPVIWIVFAGAGGYLTMMASTTLTQAIWVYGLGLPLYFVVKKYRLQYEWQQIVERGREPAVDSKEN